MQIFLHQSISTPSKICMWHLYANHGCDDDANMVLRQVEENSKKKNEKTRALIASDFPDSTFDFQTAYGMEWN